MQVVIIKTCTSKASSFWVFALRLGINSKACHRVVQGQRQQKKEIEEITSTININSKPKPRSKLDMGQNKTAARL